MEIISTFYRVDRETMSTFHCIDRYILRKSNRNYIYIYIFYYINRYLKRGIEIIYTFYWGDRDNGDFALHRQIPTEKGRSSVYQTLDVSPRENKK